MRTKKAQNIEVNERVFEEYFYVLEYKAPLILVCTNFLESSPLLSNINLLLSYFCIEICVSTAFKTCIITVSLNGSSEKYLVSSTVLVLWTTSCWASADLRYCLLATDACGLSM